MISSEEARNHLATARAEKAAAINAAPNEQERCRLAVIRAEATLAAAEYRERFTQVHPEVSVERSPDGLLLHMPSVEFVPFSPDELVELGRQLVEIGGGPAAPGGGEPNVSEGVRTWALADQWPGGHVYPDGTIWVPGDPEWVETGWTVVSTPYDFDTGEPMTADEIVARAARSAAPGEQYEQVEGSETSEGGAS